MGCDTCGKIKGYIKHEDILNYIRQKWDKNAKDTVEKKIYKSISECDWKFKINEHSEDFDNWYIICGFISFKYHEEDRMLFYDYDNLNHYENLDYYSKRGLSELVETETTYILLGYYGGSVEIIKEIVAHFGGGWVDENDCDDKEYYPVNVNVDKNIEPARCVTMDEIRKVFGNNIIIVERGKLNEKF